MSKSTTKPCVKCCRTQRNRRGDCTFCAKAHRAAHYKKNAATYRQRARDRAAAIARVHPELLRDYQLKRRFGISYNEYAQQLQAQGGVCAICKQPETAIDSRTGKARLPAVDHNHETKLVRGLLCSSCNLGLGYFNDTPALLRAAAGYLEEHQ